MEDILGNIINNSFAIAISVYLLIRMETKIEELTNSILKLDKSIHCLENNGNK